MSSCNIIVGNRLRERVLDLDSNNWTLQGDSFNFSESQFSSAVGGCKVQMRQQCQNKTHLFIHVRNNFIVTTYSEVLGRFSILFK